MCVRIGMSSLARLALDRPRPRELIMSCPWDHRALGESPLFYENDVVVPTVVLETRVAAQRDAPNLGQHGGIEHG
jgi:hypothetical protein